MDLTYEQVLTHLERAVNLLAGRVPRPKWVESAKPSAFRHVEKTIHQAIVQKLARMVSTLDAARLLLNNGFVQEQAALQRMLDEIQQDTSFLALGVIRGDHESQLHRRYLDAFFEEEFDADTAIESTQKRDMIPRKKIQAYLSDTGLYGTDRSSLTGLFRTMHKAYSGYVHAASPQIMDMYGGAPARFHMRGMSGSIVHVGHKEDLKNLFYRGIISCGVSAKAFGDENLYEECRDLMRWLDGVFSESIRE